MKKPTTKLALFILLFVCCWTLGHAHEWMDFKKSFNGQSFVISFPIPPQEQKKFPSSQERSFEMKKKFLQLQVDEADLSDIVSDSEQCDYVFNVVCLKKGFVLKSKKFSKAILQSLKQICWQNNGTIISHQFHKKNGAYIFDCTMLDRRLGAMTYARYIGKGKNIYTLVVQDYAGEESNADPSRFFDSFQILKKK